MTTAARVETHLRCFALRNKEAESMPDDTESNVLIAEDEQHSRERAVLNAINRVFREALACDSDKQVAKQCLAVAEELNH